MSDLHPETMSEKLRALGSGCHCQTCRGSDMEIDTLISGVFHKQRAEIEKLKTLVQLTRRQLWCAEMGNNPFEHDDSIPPAWNALTEKLIQDCTTAAEVGGGRNADNR